MDKKKIMIKWGLIMALVGLLFVFLTFAVNGFPFEEPWLLAVGTFLCVCIFEFIGFCAAPLIYRIEKEK